MTDYLALALEQGDAEADEERRQRETRKWNAGPAGVAMARLTARKRAETGAPRPAEAEKAGGTPPGTKLEGRTEEKSAPEAPGQKTAPTEGTASEKTRTATETVRRLSRAAAAPGTVRLGKETGGRSAAALLDGLSRAQAAASLAQGPGRQILVTLPEAGESAPGWGPEALDRAVERDARRYDGGFALY